MHGASISAPLMPIPLYANEKMNSTVFKEPLAQTAFLIEIFSDVPIIPGAPINPLNASSINSVLYLALYHFGAVGINKTPLLLARYHELLRMDTSPQQLLSLFYIFVKGLSLFSDLQIQKLLKMLEMSASQHHAFSAKPLPGERYLTVPTFTISICQFYANRHAILTANFQEELAFFIKKCQFAKGTMQQNSMEQNIIEKTLAEKPLAPMLRSIKDYFLR